MKLTKYIHSCVLLEESGEKLLIDPGVFTFSEGIDPEIFGDVKIVVVTHNHPDHLDLESLKQIVEVSGATVVASDEIKKTLEDAGVVATVNTDKTYASGAFTLESIDADHEKVLSDSLPKNLGYLINNKVLVTGDSFANSLKEKVGVEVLLLPVMAPWANEVAVFDFAKAVHPKKIIPVHDGFAKDFFLKSRYDNFFKLFEKEGIDFVKVEKPGDSVEI